MDELTLEQVTIKKVTWRLIPFLIVTYFICYLDRVNVGFAALTMNKDLGLTATLFGAGAGIFFLGYFLFEVPSNLALQKYGARFWIARIMISWGLLSAAMSLVQGKSSFLLVRFLLGAAEAGFFPGIILYLTYWFPARYRAVIVSRFMFAIPVSLLVGAPISGLILNTHGVLGLAGWKWLFILEGVPSVLLGFVTLFYLTDKPAKAQWLEPKEREWLQAQLDAERAGVESVHKKYTLGQALLNLRVVVLGLVYFTLQIGIYGVNMWLPQIMKTFGNFSTLQIGFIAAIPFACAAIGMLVWGQSSDRKLERKWHLTNAFLLGAAGLLVASLFSKDPVLTIVLLSLSSIGLYAAMPVFWTVPSIFLTGTAAAGGIALINSIGNLGGFAGPFMVGWIRDATGKFIYGLVFLGVCVLAGGVVAYICCQRVQSAAKTTAAKAAAGRV